MEKGVVEDRNKVIQDLFSGLYGANRKAKMVLELLGFRSAAALPEHLHAAVLQVLLMGPVGPFCRRPLVPVTNPGLMPQPIPLSSEGCVIQCLFADWLTKTSKWLKVPRYRYVMLLLIAPKPEEMEKGQQPIIMNSSIKGLTASPAGETPQIRGGDAEYAAFKQKNVQKPFPQLLLVAFKAPQERLSTGDHDYVDSYVLQRAEPSEVFTIDSTHRALCQRVQCGKEDQLVLIVEGLGGRLLVLGELSRSTASPSGTTKVQVSGLSPLERLAHLINEAAPFCAAPRPPRWRRLLQLFAATATAVDLGESVAIPALGGNRVKEHGRLDSALPREAQSAAGCWQVNCTASKEACSPAVREAQQTISLVALLLRFSVAACFAICRPLTVALRRCYFRSAMPRRSCAGGDACAAPSMPEGACNDSNAVPNRHNSFYCTRNGQSCDCTRREQCRVNRGQRTSSACAVRPQRTLRQLIDDQQRSLAALAVREYRRKVALVQHEYQMSRQQASRALMDEHGQLFPQARRWLDSTDGKLLMLCLTGRNWRPPVIPRS